MTHDPIIDEIRAIREAYAAQFDFDLRAIHEDLKERQKCYAARVVRLPGKPASQARPSRKVPARSDEPVASQGDSQ
jgi:hypothetical protein